MSAHHTPAAVLVLLLAGCAAAPEPAAAAEPAAAVTVPWAWEMPDCVGYDPAGYPSAGHRDRVRSGGGAVHETYQAGWAGRAMAEIGRVVAECGSYEHGGRGDPAAYLAQNAVVARGFAGDESLLVRTTHLRPPAPVRSWYAAVVRHGDVVVTARAPTRDGAVWAAAPATCRRAGP